MKSIVSRRPSPALIVSILALVVAMAGTSYAAFKLPKNSVGTKQLKKNAVATAKIKSNAVTTKKIKKNAVTGVKVRNHTLTGADINLAKLGTVPSATSANSAATASSATTASTADVANSLSPLEPKHVVGAPGEPGFENGFHSAADEAKIPFNPGPVAFYKDHEGIVHLEGLVVGSEGEGLPSAFTLPPGFRPAAGTVQFFITEALVAGSNTSVEGVDVSGKVLVSSFGLLNGITFRAES